MTTENMLYYTLRCRRLPRHPTLPPGGRPFCCVDAAKRFPFLLPHPKHDANMSELVPTATETHTGCGQRGPPRPRASYGVSGLTAVRTPHPSRESSEAPTGEDPPSGRLPIWYRCDRGATCPKKSPELEILGPDSPPFGDSPLVGPVPAWPAPREAPRAVAPWSWDR